MRTLVVAVATTLLLAGGVAAQEATPAERLWRAARVGDLETLRELLDAGVPVDARTEFDATALYFAANANQAEAIRLLADAGADVNAGDSSYGFSALGMAGWLGNREAVAALIDVGADPGDAIGAYFAAISNDHEHVVEEIVSRGLIAPPMLVTGLDNARSAGADEVVAKLIELGAKGSEPAEETAAASDDAASDDAAAAGSAKSEAGDRGAESAVAGGATEPQTATDRPGETAPGALARPLVAAEPANWPEFRGPARSGVADGQVPPLSWGLDTGRNVAWSIPVDGLGLSSPVIWDGVIYVTTATTADVEQSVAPSGRGRIDTLETSAVHRWQVRAYDLDSGELIWARTARAGVPSSGRHWKASQANPTCAVDGKRVVASFGSEGIYAYDLDGDLLWRRDFGEMNAGWYVDEGFEWGFASSPALFEDRLFLQVDVHGDSFVAALDAATGETLWQTPREEIPSWGTPLPTREGGRAQVVLNATKAIVSYDVETGEELWRIEGNSMITVASPIAGDDFLLVTGGYRQPKPIYVVRPDADGEIEPGADGVHPHLVWSRQTDGVYQPTPLYYRGLLYLHRDNGVLAVLDPATGEELAEERVTGRVTASPVAADGRIYLTAEDGTVTVIGAGPELEVLVENQLDATTLATPAISDGRIVFRTVRGLVAVGGSKRAG